MEHSKFARNNKKNLDHCNNVFSLSEFRTKKSNDMLVAALKIIKAAEPAAAVLRVVTEQTIEQRQALFASQMFAITGDIFYNTNLRV